MCQFVAEVVIDGATGSFDKRFTYAIPDNLRKIAQPGCRVTIPFGKGNIKKQGMILALYQGETNAKIKSILSVTDNHPILNDEMIKMC